MTLTSLIGICYTHRTMKIDPTPHRSPKYPTIVKIAAVVTSATAVAACQQQQQQQQQTSGAPLPPAQVMGGVK
ncbi:MAG: hypothetical protein Q4F35_06915 [Akkermansia sp.]|nr:hypothetical protein [Akkermansia sp.]